MNLRYNEAYPDSALRLGRWMFHLYMGLLVFFETAHLPNGAMLSMLASVGLGSTAVFWWLVDSMRLRREIPMISLWIPFRLWPVVLPAHYFATRGRAGTRKLIAHLAIMAVTCATTGLLGAMLFPE